MIYLASVYSYNPEGFSKARMKQLMQKRYNYARKRASEYIKKSVPVFSPITHCHPMAAAHEMPKEWEFWEGVDKQYIDSSEAVLVLKMPYWEDSKGITAEIAYAESKGIPVMYAECPDYKE